MSEPEKKSSAWPWIAVPVAAVIVFFVLRECQHRLPPADHVSAPGVPAPATPAAEPAAADSATPAPAPAQQ